MCLCHAQLKKKMNEAISMKFEEMREIPALKLTQKLTQMPCLEVVKRYLECPTFQVQLSFSRWDVNVMPGQSSSFAKGRSSENALKF